MKVAVIQLRALKGQEKNFQQAVERIIEAAMSKAKLILLPEMFLCQEGDIHDPLIDVTPRKEMRLIKDLAKRFNLAIVAGSIYEKDNRQNLRKIKKAQAQYFNTCCFINDDGKISGKYRKIHLFDADVNGKKIRESEKFLPGFLSRKVFFQEFCFGLSICYDLRFSSLYRKYYQEKVDVFCVPSAFTLATGEKHWEVLLRARAIENFSYVLAANQCGKNANGVDLYGNSMIIDPEGRVLARASEDQTEVLYAEIDKSIIDSIRKSFINYSNYQ